MAYLQLIAFSLLAVPAFLAGRRIAGMRLWWLGAALPLALIFLVMLGHRIPRLQFVAPMSWCVDADLNPLLMTPAIAVLFGTLLAKLHRRRVRIAAATFMAAMLVNYGLLPAILPLAVRPTLAATPTRFDKHGICMQTHEFTCGPAAAVTCLDQLGLAANEGRLAIDVRCGPGVGTNGFLLAKTISEQYPSVHCDYRYVDSLDDLTTPAVVEVSTPFLTGHYVSVLEIHPNHVVLGDPQNGLVRLPREAFLAMWKHTAITFTRR